MYIGKQLKDKKLPLCKMNNQYHDHLNKYIENMTSLMYTFQITKLCGYSVFITIYKTETLIDLYKHIIDHFGNCEIKELFFYAPSGERIRIPISKTIVSDFVRDKIICNPIKLEPIYPLPNPVIYRIYLDDGCCCASEHCTNNHHFRQPI
jgi:hypothetical protein